MSTRKKTTTAPPLDEKSPWGGGISTSTGFAMPPGGWVPPQVSSQVQAPAVVQPQVPTAVQPQAPAPLEEDPLEMVSVRLPRSVITELEVHRRELERQYMGQRITLSGMIRGIAMQWLAARDKR